MAFEPESDVGKPAASGVPVQPELGQDPTLSTWLLDEQIELAESVDRMAGDVDLVFSLALGRYEGRDWEYFATELAKYGMAVIGGWMKRKLIFARCQTRGYGGLPRLDRGFTQDEIDELTGETVSKALHHFRLDVLMKNRWDPTRGATLRTFFIGQCLIRFANVYRRWFAGELRNRFDATDDMATIDKLFNGRSCAPDQAAVEWVAAVRTIDTVKDMRVQQAMILSAAGKPQADIAEFLGVTEKAVERMLANERTRLRRREAG